MSSINKYSLRGYFDESISNGSVWSGKSIFTKRRFKDNFQVVSTDFDTYAILYTCTNKKNYDKEVITVVSRISPALGELPEGFEDKVRSEFERLFSGDSEIGDKFL